MGIKKDVKNLSSSGTRVNNLLDAIPCEGRDCYDNVKAISYRLAISSDKLLKFDGNYWHKYEDSNLLINTNNTFLNRNNIAGYSKYARLYYNQCPSSYQYVTYCSLMGWRNPSYLETTVYNSQGVPSCNQGYTWTSTSNGISYYYLWSGNSLYTGNDSITAMDVEYSRCVK